jgi:ATP-dependent RNA helicase RhlB
MAFGFLKKVVAALFGGNDSKARKSGKKTRRGEKGHSNKGSSQTGKNSKMSRHQHGKSSHSPNSDSKSQQHSKRKDANNRNRQEDCKRSQRRGDFKDRKNHSSFDSDPNFRRPGGEISSKEVAERRAAHEKWSIDQFVVEPIEGKKRFHDFNLPSEVMHGIAELGFQYCTKIQELSLEQALAGKNIAGKAQTGSGKTAAFLVSIFARYLSAPKSHNRAAGSPRALVIAPTRELVIQICKDADAIGKYTNLSSLAVYGGMDYERQKREVLSGSVDLLVATPGRLLDFVKTRVINLSEVDTLVIDEADRMLDMGFIPDVRRIMNYLPSKDKRTTMLYSATLNDTVMRLASNWMLEPYRAEVESEINATDTVKQVVYIVRSEDKFKVLFNHIALHPDARTIVFCNRKVTTEDVYQSLKVRGVSVEMLSGDVSQTKRLKVLDQFRDGEIKVMVSTDVAGRGIDIKGLEYVINFDFPYEAEDYVHRIGRTGRAGSTGIAISFADEDESFAIPDIEQYIKEPLKCTMLPEDDPLLKPLPARGTTLGDVDSSARAEVDAREAAGEDEKAAAAQMVGSSLKYSNAVTGNGHKAVLREDSPDRTLPTFEHAFDTKKEAPDESNVYSKPVDQVQKLEEWSVDT